MSRPRAGGSGAARARLQAVDEPRSSGGLRPSSSRVLGWFAAGQAGPRLSWSATGRILAAAADGSRDEPLLVGCWPASRRQTSSRNAANARRSAPGSVLQAIRSARPPGSASRAHRVEDSVVLGGDGGRVRAGRRSECSTVLTHGQRCLRHTLSGWPRDGRWQRCQVRAGQGGAERGNQPGVIDGVRRARRSPSVCDRSAEEPLAS